MTKHDASSLRYGEPVWAREGRAYYAASVLSVDPRVGVRVTFVGDLRPVDRHPRDVERRYRLDGVDRPRLA